MRLKRLEIQGFKSFARPVTLEFGQGITAIVGPNGSGKSNISDALRWVLGEQSARSLRGQKMEDIIFAGSEGKKPLGMAEVQLTLDNTQGYLPVDYSEVTVARRVYRSGESEFFINKQSCRLRDIHDLFTDTGLGREGYAIIGQGQIETVLSVRSEDRRILLEETAGIVKYRQRKEQALNKLDETGTDLLRVTDILHELEGRLEPLGKQAEKAKVYLELAEDLQTRELDYYALTWRNLEQESKQSEEKFAELQLDYNHWDKKVTDLDAAKQALETELGELESFLAEKQSELVSLKEKYNQGIHNIQLHQERLKNNGVRLEQLNTVLLNEEDQVKVVEKEIEVLEQEFKSLLDQISTQETLIAQAETEHLNLQETQRSTQVKINQLKDDFFEYMRHLADQRNFQREFSTKEQALRQQIEVAQAEIEEIRQSLSSLRKQGQLLQSQRQECEESLSKQMDEHTYGQEKLKTKEQVLFEQQKDTRQFEGEQMRLASRVKTLQELEEGYEGYAFGVRRIMQNPEMSKKVLGTVADLIKVPEGLETAFEVALGAGLQNMVTQNEADAKSLIAWLQKVKGGRVTILPLDTMRGSEFSPQQVATFRQEGVLGTALDLLSFSDKYRPALASLLGRVIITEDLDTALQLKKKSRQFSRIVTRDGSVVFPSGAMTGGSLNTRTSGLLARKGELQSLDLELQAITTKLREIQEQEKETKLEILTLQNQLEELQKNQVQMRLQLQSTIQSLEQNSHEEQSWLQTQQRLAEKVSDLETLLANLQSESEVAATSLVKLAGQEEGLRKQIASKEAELVAVNAQIEGTGEVQTQQKVELAQLKGSLENLRIQRANLEQRKKTSLAVQSEAQAEQGRLQSEKVEHERLIVETTQKTKEYLALQEELTGTIAKETKERQIKQKENSGLDLELRQAQKEQMQRERVLYKWEVEMEQVEQKRAKILQELEERQFNLAQIVNLEVDVDEPSLKRTLDSLRRKIKNLGPVNPGATQEFEEVQERCHFLQEQLADLNEARDSLQAVINEMDKLCRTKLQEAFDQVRVEFQKIFSQLFSGGQADLVLTDPESILTTGIEVMARPPGKKLQNLLLLSGGERSLTAIALLFAIRKVKPTPFCVLDEIDAALDESNLGRFTELMEEFARESQFLVITHRPRTMEGAHTLYGITMSDAAFSEVISVELS